VGQITVFSGPERRRRWSNEQRLRILTEAFAPGACPTEVARRHEISTGQLYTWRSKLAVDAPPAPDDGDSPGFAEAVVIKGGDTALSGSGAAIVIDLPRDRRITIFASASPALATAALKALR
jgi:transposase